MRAIRLPGNPIITPRIPGGDTIGPNINGPSLIRAPDWLPDRLGRYYLYFADHSGTYIRLAYAEHLHGPWQIHRPGTLTLKQTAPHFQGHIASPDVHVDEQARQIRMYVHGPVPEPFRQAGDAWAQQMTSQQTILATSSDGLHFQAHGGYLANSYLRVFQWRGWYYGISMPGILWRSRDGMRDFQRGPVLFEPDLLKPGHIRQFPSPRHFAVRVAGDTLQLLLSRVGDCPEHIMVSTVVLHDDWQRWQACEPISLLMPEMTWEGGDQPLVPSRIGSVRSPVRQLRDPAVFEEDDQLYLVYAVAGETGLAIARLQGF